MCMTNVLCLCNIEHTCEVMLNDRLHIEYTIAYTIVNGYICCVMPCSHLSPVMADHDTTKHFRFKHHFSSINIQVFT